MAENKPKEERIEKVLDAAVDLFLIMGYERTSMNAIAQKAGLTKGGLYHHFSSKEEILIYVNNRFMEPVHDMMAEAMTFTSAEQALIYYIRKSLEYWAINPEKLKIIFLTLTRMLDSREMWPFMEEYSESVIEFYQDLFGKGIENREFIEHDCTSRATALFSAMDGITAITAMNSGLNYAVVSDRFIHLFVDEIKR